MRLRVVRPEQPDIVSAEEEDPSYRYRLLAILLTATMFSVMNSSMVNVALPTLMRDFHIGISVSVWLYTAYTLPYAVAMPLMGALGERIGPKDAFLYGVTGFLVGSLLCSAAWGFLSLAAFRVLQALGAAAVVPNAMVMITSAFPPNQRGQALGIWSAVAGVGAGIGPALGGFLTQYASWHAIFWVNGPFLLAVALIGRRAIRPLPVSEKARRFDLPGALLLVIGLGALMLGLTTGQTNGWTALETIALFLVAVLGVAAFLVWEFRSAIALLPIALFRTRAYFAATATVFLQAMAMFGLLLLLPVYLQSVRGHTPTEAGLMILPMSAAMVISAPFGGRLSDRLGPRPPAVSGMLCVTIAMIAFSRLTLTSSYMALAIALVVAGVGIGFSISPLTSTAMNAATPAERGAASGFFNTLRFVGAVLGTTLLGVILSSRTTAALGSVHAPSAGLREVLAQMQGFHDVFLVGAAIAAASMLVGLTLQPGHGARRAQ